MPATVSTCVLQRVEPLEVQEARRIHHDLEGEGGKAHHHQLLLNALHHLIEWSVVGNIVEEMEHVVCCLHGSYDYQY